MKRIFLILHDWEHALDLRFWRPVYYTTTWTGWSAVWLTFLLLFNAKINNLNVLGLFSCKNEKPLVKTKSDECLSKSYCFIANGKWSKEWVPFFLHGPANRLHPSPANWFKRPCTSDQPDHSFQTYTFPRAANSYWIYFFLVFVILTI